MHFFGVRSPSKNSLYWKTLEILFRLPSQKKISQNSTKGDPLGRQGVESMKKGSPPIKSATG